MQIIRWFYLSALFVALVLGMSASSALADGSDDGEDAGRDIQAVLDVIPGMDEQFDAARELIEDREWDRLMERLARIDEEVGDSVWAPKGERVHISVRDYLLRLILTLPEEGIGNYRVRYDVEARALYDRAKRERSVPDLDAVARRFPASSYAVPALNTAARLLMDRGEYGAAAGRLNQLVNRPAVAGETAGERRTKRMASVKLAFCRARLGDASGAERAIARLKEEGLNGELRLAGGDLTVDEFIRQALDAGPMDTAIVRAKDYWPGPGGHIDHRRPMVEVRTDLLQWWWKKIGEESDRQSQPTAQQTAAQAHQIRLAMVRRGGQVQARITAAPIPITDQQGVVYLNTGEKLLAIDHITGRLRWMAEPADPPEADAQPAPHLRHMHANAERALWVGWQGAATVSYGGHMVFATETRSRGVHLHRALSAFDASGGQRLWSILEQPDSMEFEERAFFPWAPKYFEGQLVTLASYQDQMFICSLDAETGELLWKQFLAADPVPSIDARRQLTMTRGLGQPVVISDGVAYGATGMGAVAAVDVHSGDLYWITKYDRTAIKTTTGGSQHRPVTQYSAEGGWEAGFPVVDGGKLYVAPWDSQELLVLDARSGELVTTIPGSGYTHFVGLHRGRPILTGERHTAAFDPHTGRREWRVSTGIKPSGIPILTESSVVVPGDRQLAIIRLDRTPVARELHTVEPRPEYPSKSGLGNLVVCSGRLIAVNEGYASAFFSYDKTRAELTRLVEEQHPPRVRPLLDRSDISSLGGDRAFSDGEREQARDRYRQALEDLEAAEKLLDDKQAPPSELVSRHQRMMFETRLKLAETDSEHALTHIDAAQPYIYNDLAEVRFHMGRGEALTVGGRYQDAVDQYRHLVDNKPEFRLRVGESNVRVGLLAQERIGKLVKEHGHEVYARVDQALKPKYQQLVEERKVEALLALQARHPHSSLADAFLLQAGRLVQDSEHGMLRSQTILRSLTLRYPESDLLGEAFAMLLENCIETSQYRLAAVVLGDIADKHPDIEIGWRGETLSGEALVARLMETEELTKASGLLRRELPVLTTPLAKVWESGNEPEMLANVVSDDSCFDRGIGLAARVGPREGQPAFGRVTGLRAFYTSSGETLWQKDVDVDLSYGTIETEFSMWGRNRIQVIVVCSGSVVALCHPDGIIAVDITTGKQLWTHTWNRPVTNNPRVWVNPQELRGVNALVRQALNSRPTVAAEGGRIFYYLPDGKIGALEAATGRKVWDVAVAGYATGPIGLLGEALVVGTIEPNRLRSFNILTGQELNSQEMTGASPGVPAYDVARRRVFTSDGERLYCYRAADFELLWRGGRTANTLNNQPWSLQVLPDGNVVATKRVRFDRRVGLSTILYDGESGKRKWDIRVCEYEQDGMNRDQVSMSGIAMIGEGRVIIPAQDFSMRRPNQRQITQRRQILLTMADYETGETVQSYREEAPAPRGNHRTSMVMPIAMRATAGHVVMMMHRNVRGQQSAHLTVVDAEAGKSVFEDELPDALYANQQVRFFRQGAEPLVTVEGYLIVPTGEGLRCYGPTAADDNQE